LIGRKSRLWLQAVAHRILCSMSPHHIPDGSLPNPLPPYRSEQCESLWQLEPAIVSQHARVLYERPKLRGYDFHLVGLAEFEVYKVVLPRIASAGLETITHSFVRPQAFRLKFAPVPLTCSRFISPQRCLTVGREVLSLYPLFRTNSHSHLLITFEEFYLSWSRFR
jgi:hypothetical protein